MAGKVAARRSALRETLIDIAEQVIGDVGLQGLKARDLAAQAGCAVGAIYNVFGDLNDLVLAVNARTFARMGAAVTASLQDAPDDPTQHLITMAQAYHAFAAANYNHWRALFDLDRPAGEAAPDWYLDEMGQLFAHIAAPLAQLTPGHDPDEAALLTRALFSAVHGIVLLGLDEASAGVPAKHIDRMLALVLGRLVA